MAFAGFRNALASAVPKWMQNRPFFQIGFKILWAFASVLDFFFAQVTEGQAAAWPGIGTPTALALIGQSRGILRGEIETSPAYAKRLQGWRATWEGAGSSEVLVKQIQAYLGNTPTVRVVDRAGNWVSIAPDGTTTKVQAGSASWVWNWDGTSNPERSSATAPWWSDLWIIVYPCEWPVTAGTTGGGGLDAIWGRSDIGIGHAVPRAANDAIRALAQQWKGAHTWVEAIIWSYDATLFDPAVVNASNPTDGTWGNWAYDARDGNGMQPRRAASARYWIPPNG